MALWRSVHLLNRAAVEQWVRTSFPTLADVYLLDMEDAVPAKEKADTRKYYAPFVHNWVYKIPLYVRVNGWENEKELLDDVNVLLTKNITGVFLPKVEDQHEILKMDQLLAKHEQKMALGENKFKIVSMIESPLASFRSLDIAQCCPGRHVALAVGSYDFSAECGVAENSAALDNAIQTTIFAAKSTGLSVISSSGICDMSDMIELEKRCQEVKACGLDGIITLSNAQTTVAQKVFSQSRKEVEMAKIIKKMYEEESSKLFQASPQESQILMAQPFLKIAQKTLEKHGMETEYDNKKQDMLPSDATNVNSMGQKYQKAIPIKTKNAEIQGKSAGYTFKTPFEITLFPSIKTAWDMSFFNQSLMCSSQEWAKRCGMSDVHVPFTLLPFLAISMAVSIFTENARYHIGLSNGHQLDSVCIGDTVRGRVTILDVQPAGTRGQFDIITSKHEITNTSGTPVYSIEKKTMFPSGVLKQGKSNEAEKETSQQNTIHQLQYQPPWVSDAPVDHTVHPVFQVKQPYIHRLVKVCGHSETRSLSHLLWLTNPHHYDTARYASKDLVVGGPFVTAASIANTGLDYGHVMYEEMVKSVNVNKVNMGDLISSISYVLSVKPLPENKAMQEMEMLIFGILNIDPEELSTIALPEQLFALAQSNTTPKSIEALLQTTCPQLFHRVASITTRRVITISQVPCSSN